MPERTPACQLGRRSSGDSRLISPRAGDTDTRTPLAGFEHASDYSDDRFVPVRGVCQEVAHTKSRRSGPRRWLRAVRWLIAAGLHSRATATTLRIAEDLAPRMDYTSGHVRYCMLDIADRLGIDKSTVKRHMAVLRELGALAWVEHGTLANVRRTLGLGGYAATATVYAAVIPPVYDEAMGHTVVGSGYGARIVIDQRGQAPVVPVDNSPAAPVDNSRPGRCAPPSRTGVEEVGQVDLVGGVTTTARRTRNDSTPNQPKSSGKRRATILGAIVTAKGMQLGDKLARTIRRRVPWVRRASHNQLRWVCADMGEQAWTEDQAVRFVVEAGHQHGAGFAWHPARPHRLLAAELLADRDRQAADAQYRADMAVAIPWEESTAYREQQAARAALEALLATEEGETFEVPKPAYTAEDRERAQLYGWDDWERVAAHYAEDPDDALDLYDKPLCSYAVGRAARLEWQESRV